MWYAQLVVNVCAELMEPMARSQEKEDAAFSLEVGEGRLRFGTGNGGGGGAVISIDSQCSSGPYSWYECVFGCWQSRREVARRQEQVSCDMRRVQRVTLFMTHWQGVE